MLNSTRSLTNRLSDAMPLSAAAKLIPSRNGKPISVSTIVRWQQSGLMGPNGRRVYLRTIRVGGQRCVTHEAIEAFLAELNPDCPQARQPPVESTEQRAKSAGRALDALGS